MVKHYPNGKTLTGNIWEVGNEVKVGFLKLRVTHILRANYGQTEYLLVNFAGDKKYSFVPHHGVRRTN